MIRKKLLVMVMGFLGYAASVKAQDIQSNTEGFNIGVHAGVGNWSSSYFLNLDELEPIGVGGGLRLGYGLNQRFEVFAQYNAKTFAMKNDWDTYRISSLGAGIRVHFGGTLQRLRPYVEGGVAGVNLLINPVLFNGDLVEYRLKGPSLALGAGVNYFLSPNLALHANATGTFGKFNSFQVNSRGIQDRPDVRTLQFSLGINFFFN